MLKPDINNNFYVKEIIKVNNLLHRYLCFIEALCCSRCWRDSVGRKDVWHAPGGFLYLLGQNPKISQENLAFWKTDLEHGLFHGFCVGFWIFAQQLSEKELVDSVISFQGPFPVSEKTLHVEKMFYSCFFHDYLKCIGHIEKHDVNLEKIFPMCPPNTYFHENPSEQNNEDFLIVADRIELNRYEDKSWIDAKILNTSKFIKNKKKLINLFYTHVRPCLKKIYSNLGELWISHTSENMYTNIHKVHENFYPEYYWSVREKTSEVYGFDETDEKYASINMDYLPLTNCHKDILNMNSVFGLITKNDLINIGVSINHSPKSIIGRDHAFMVLHKKIPINNWIFSYTNEKNLNYINVKKNKIISFDNVNKFYSITRLLLGKIEGLKVV